MTAMLTFTGEDGRSSIPFTTLLTIGRDKNSDIVLPDLQVSRNHAMVRMFGNGDYYLIDGGSSNGSFVNRKPVSRPHLLRDGDQIRIGSMEFRFEQDHPSARDDTTLSLQDTVFDFKPEIKQNTILVADIRGFTSMSETIPIATLTRLMNRWFREVSDVILNCQGMIDKFIGDCVFARWETHDNEVQTVLHALMAAEAINRVTEGVNKAFGEVPEQLRIGVGINTGAASVGSGLQGSALGDAVNVAFRLESATKDLRQDIAMSEASYSYLPESIWKGRTKSIHIKGKRDALNVFPLNFPDARQILNSVESDTTD